MEILPGISICWLSALLLSRMSMGWNYCRKEGKSPRALLTDAVLMGNVYIGVFCLNSFQRSYFKIGKNRCSGTLTNKFCDDIIVEVCAELPYLHVSVWKPVTLTLLKHPLSIFLWIAFTKAQTVPCSNCYHCFSSLYRWCFKPNMCHELNNYPAS